jgi:hypothetical protein
MSPHTANGSQAAIAALTVKALALLLLGAAIAPSLGAQNINVALGGTASQSIADSFGSQPGWAIDGSRNGFSGHNSVASCYGGLGQWWQVVLGSPGIVNEVVLFNRTHVGAERMSALRVEVLSGNTVAFSQDLFTNGGSVPSGGQMRFKVPGAGVSATRVRITNVGVNAEGNHDFHLAEVEVIRYGQNREVNLARYGTATASQNQSEVSRVIDGSTDGFWANNTSWGNWGPGGQTLQIAIARHRIDQIRVWPVNTGSGGWTIGNYRLAIWDNGAEVWGQDFLPGPTLNNMRPLVVNPPAGTDGDQVRITSLYPASQTIRMEFAEIEILQFANYLGERWTFGPGCRSSVLTEPQLNSAVRPVIGTAVPTWVTRVPPPGVVLLMLGLSDANYGGLPLPLELGGIGAPGCWLMVSPDVTMAGTTLGSGIPFVLQLPTTPGSLGTTIFQQAALLNPPANAFGVVLTNAMEQFIGL